MVKSVKIGLLFSMVVLLAGCNTYNNFRAYYNTYYNAKKNFRAGVEEVEKQPVQIDPSQIIFIYPSPVPAGRQEFEAAIKNAVQVLRRFPETNRADDALLLIGKSYFYQQQYFKALQKFEALLNLSRETGLKYEAMLWKSRVLLVTGSFQTGVDFMRKRMLKQAEGWSESQKARAKTELAQHLAWNENIKSAADTLITSLPYLENKEAQGRGYFLLGQLYMRLNEFTKSYQAFSNVGGNAGYEVGFFARLKSARAAGLAGQSALAESIFNKMLRDDKNNAHRGEILYRRGRLAEQNGDFKKAGKLYKQALRQVQNSMYVSNANIYYRLAQLHGRYFQDYKTAAAYFDSSQSARKQQASTGAADTEAYERYIALKAEISKTDSLLWLASLSPAALDSVVIVIQQRNQIQLRRQLSVNNPDDNRLANLSPNGNESSSEAYSSAYGFLNYRNEALAAAGVRTFRAVWGPRPLADNWRRAEAVSTVSIADQKPDSTAAIPSRIDKISEPRAGAGMLLNEIPFTPKEQKVMLGQKKRLQYRLANLFFLTLDKPDSAAVYFKKALKNGNEKLAAKALYSLYQLYKLEGEAEKAAGYRDAVLERYPKSIYAARIKRASVGEPATAAGLEALREKAYRIISDTALTTSQRAKKLEQLALSNQASEIAPFILYQSLRQFIKAAKGYEKAADTLHADKQFVYAGERWQKVRSVIAVFQNLFPEAPQAEQVAVWYEMLRKKPTLLTCKETDDELQIIGGMEAFIAKAELSQKIKGMNISGTLAYSIVINQQGEVQSYELISNPTGLGIEAAYGKAIEKHLRFEPVRYKGKAIKAMCRIEFPIKVKREE